MFLRSTLRKKDGKEHRYWSVVESRRVGGGRVVQRPALYLGEINSSQELAWRRSIEVMEDGAARQQAPTAWRLIAIELAPDRAAFSYRLNRAKLRQVRRREGRYLLRTNLVADDPAQLWAYYLQLVTIEKAFKTLKGDLAIRPIFHQLEARIEAHIFIAFLAYCLHVTLAQRRRALAPGLTPRSVLETFAALQMIDLHVPTTDGRELLLTRYTEPEPELRLLLHKLKLTLPDQPRPKITARHSLPSAPM